MILALLCNVRVCTEKSCILHLKAKQLQIINVLVYMLLCHGEDFKSSSKYNTCSIFFWIDAWMGRLLQLLVIINYLVLFIGYSYQTLVMYPTCMLYRYNVSSDIIVIFCYFIVTLYGVYTLHIVPIYLIIVMILPLMGPWLEINTFVLYCCYFRTKLTGCWHH